MNSSTTPNMHRYWCAAIWFRVCCSKALRPLERGRARQALRQEVAAEVELLVLAQHVVELPLRPAATTPASPHN